MAEPADSSPGGQPAAPERVECPASREPAIRKFVIAALLLGFGIWCFADRHKFPRPDSWSQNINQTAGYLLNHYGLFVLGPVGLAVAAWGLLGLRRRLQADPEGIGYVGQPRIAWADVEGLDASQLQSKGILILRHGQGRALKLDSYYLRNFRDLVAVVERNVPADRHGTT